MMTIAANARVRRAIRICLVFIIAITSLGTFAFQTSHNTAFAANRARTPGDADLFGMVIRDPFYEFNTDPVNYPMAANKGALEQMAKELSAAGVRWIRMEFFADYDGTVPPGEINWSKYDWFISELAPKYGFKVLALLNVGLVSYKGATVRTVAFNDPPDEAGADPTDGTNHFIRVFRDRAASVAAHYGTAISAYEIINEPNISWDLWLDSQWGEAEIKSERYSCLITTAYESIKTEDPHAEILTGGMVIGSPPEGQNRNQFDYLYELYTSTWVAKYKAEGNASKPGWNVVPWDGVALHPYYTDVTTLFILLNEFTQKMHDRGDFKSKLWLTEIGAPADPPSSPNDPPSQAEIDQAYYLNAIYSGILNNTDLRSAVAHVFWFKYEDFVPGNYTHNYGVVRLLENDKHDNYSPTGQVWVHKLAYHVYQELALNMKITDPVPEADARAQNLFYFSQTHQAIAPEFTEYWIEKGGVEQFGYPISQPAKIKGVLSQFFQRAVFEYHPELADSGNTVLLRLIGRELAQGRVFAPITAIKAPLGSIYFPQTGHSLGSAFLTFWTSTGGLAVYGYPISEPEIEKAPDGHSYTVQYFERNRLELHPEAAGTPYEVQLGLLGAALLKQDRWWR
ncbi:MAG TPA: hypothetical protein VLQ48_14880 [Chloroflexia bacterium]|nr:hypothetical protein [Chloroflexia bacterium]